MQAATFTSAVAPRRLLYDLQKAMHIRSAGAFPAGPKQGGNGHEERIDQLLCRGRIDRHDSVGRRHLGHSHVGGPAGGGAASPAAHAGPGGSAGPRGSHLAARPASAGQQPAASPSGPSYVRLRGRGHLRVRSRPRGAEDAEGRRRLLRAAGRPAFDLAQSKHGPAHEDFGFHGGRPEEPEHGGRETVTCRRRAPATASEQAQAIEWSGIRTLLTNIPTSWYVSRMNAARTRSSDQPDARTRLLDAA